MSEGDYVTLENVEVGIDSNTGAAFSCKINGKHEWVPYSQTRARHINKRVHDADSIEVKRWLAEKNGWV